MSLIIRIGDVLSVKERKNANGSEQYEMQVTNFKTQQNELSDSDVTRCLLKFKNVVQKYMDPSLSTSIISWGHEFEVNEVKRTETSITYVKNEGIGKQIYIIKMTETQQLKSQSWSTNQEQKQRRKRRWINKQREKRRAKHNEMGDCSVWDACENPPQNRERTETSSDWNSEKGEMNRKQRQVISAIKAHSGIPSLVNSSEENSKFVHETYDQNKKDALRKIYAPHRLNIILNQSRNKCFSSDKW